MAADPDTIQEMLLEFRWIDAVMEFLTGGGDQTLAVVMPSFLYGVAMTGYFIVGRSPIIPAVISIIFAGIIYSYVPSVMGQVIGIAILGMTATAGFALMLRTGRLSS